MDQRLRSAFLRGNSLVVVLRLLRGSDLSEWELLSTIHQRFGWAPEAKEFRRLCDLLLESGYADLVLSGQTRRLKITGEGAELLVRLEDHYRAIMSGLDDSWGALLTR